jgi:hypothetical protein
MKLFFSSFFIFFTLNCVNAQVGIGTTNPAATLDITATSSTGTTVEGVLIPRVSRQRAKDMLTTPSISTLVYINTLNGTVDGTAINITSLGFYFFNGTVWEKLASGVSNAWMTTGNSGLSGTTNFLGTTDDVDVAFRRNNSSAGKIGLTSTSFGAGALNAGASTNSTAIGNNALSVSTGQNNVAVGQNALRNSNTTAQWNTAVGNNALMGISDPAAQHNTAIGFNALSNGVGNFSNCVAIGSNALLNTREINNTGIGYQAGSTITTGYNNIAIGHNAQVPNGSNHNQVRIGDGFITYAGIQVAWTITSDERWKSNIKDSELGLNFIQKLRPVSYIRNNDEKAKTEYGFIAQEIEKAFINAGDSNNGVISKDDAGMYGVRYNDFISITVKAIQEQQSMIEILQKKNEELMNMNASILKRLEELEKKQ